MKYLAFTILSIALFVSCKKENYGYTCSCTKNSSGARDTSYTIRVETSGEASFLCKEYQDTANVYGKDITCELE